MERWPLIDWQKDTNARQRLARRAFTLLELLIVIAIIALLMSLSFAAMTGLSDQAEEDATATTIQKVNRLLEQRVEAFDRALRNKSRMEAAERGTRKLLADANIFLPETANFQPTVEMLARKASFRFEFPQRMIERIVSNDPVSPIAGVPNSIYQQVLFPRAKQDLIAEGNAAPSEPQIRLRATIKWTGGTDGAKSYPGHDPTTESSELLYFALVESGNFGASPVDADRFTSEEVKDTDQDGLPEFVDFWGRPLRFYRWPTRLIDPDAPVPFKPSFDDPNDLTDVQVVVGASVVGNRVVTVEEREIAGLLIKGLPPSPAILPNNALPRDLLLTDPDDPVGTLYTALEQLDADPDLSSEFNDAKYHTPDTYHTPLIVSAGKDGVLGIYEPNDTGNLGNLANYDNRSNPVEIREKLIDDLSDNITNRNRRVGGRRR